MRGPSNDSSESCFICDAATGCHDKWYNAPLKVVSRAVALPAVGCLVDPYILACPVRHVPALRMLRQDEAVEFALFVESMHADLFGRQPVTMFEHGGCGGESRSSACVQHAHLHMMAGDFGIASAPGIELLARAHGLLDALMFREAPRVSYLLLSDGGSWMLAKDPQVSQFFRRHIARELGIPDEWDYAASPRYDGVGRTISRAQVSS